jgi:hypothetical protein
MWGVQYTPEVSQYLTQWDRIARSGFHWWPRVGVVVCSQRPTYISMVNGRLDADGRKAVEFSDGWGVYSCDGTRLPESYGATKRAEWKAEWLLTEKNAELKRCLIQNIGYDKIAQQLNAKTLDSWEDRGRGGLYELVKVGGDVDVEPILLCKMSCPSTGAPYMIRVPPDITKAYDAITWIRHGIPPEQFICQH